MITLDASDLQSKLKALDAAMREGARDATKATAEESRRFIQSGAYWTNRTGKTSASFRVVRFGATGHSVTSNNAIAGYLETGTRPHVISAKPGGTLRFVQNGQVRFAKSVRHPGTKPKHFAEAEDVRTAPILESRALKAAEAAVAKVGLS